LQRWRPNGDGAFVEGRSRSSITLSLSKWRSCCNMKIKGKEGKIRAPRSCPPGPGLTAVIAAEHPFKAPPATIREDSRLIRVSRRTRCEAPHSVALESTTERKCVHCSMQSIDGSCRTVARSTCCLYGWPDFVSCTSRLLRRRLIFPADIISAGLSSPREDSIVFFVLLCQEIPL